MTTPPVRPAERYGDIRPAWHSTLARVLVSTLAVIGLVWVGYAGWANSHQDVNWTDIGYKIVDDGQIDATFDVSVQAGSTATCVVQALASDFSVVGRAEVTVPAPPAGKSAVRATVPVLTQQRAVTATVQTCALR